MLPGDWDLAHAIRLGIKPFAKLGANSEASSGSQVDSPSSCRAIFESALVAMLQSQKNARLIFFWLTPPWPSRFMSFVIHNSLNEASPPRLGAFTGGFRRSVKAT